MCEASRIVLGGFELGTDSAVVQYPDRYMDERGRAMWDKVMDLLQKAETQGAVEVTTDCCQQNNTPVPLIVFCPASSP